MRQSFGCGEVYKFSTEVLFFSLQIRSGLLWSEGNVKMGIWFWSAEESSRLQYKSTGHKHRDGNGRHTGRLGYSVGKDTE